MTPQAPQGAALSDADIDTAIDGAGLPETIQMRNLGVYAMRPVAHRLCRAIEAQVLAADRRLTAEQGGADDAMNRDVSSMSRKELEQTVGSLRVAVIERAFNALPQPQAEPIEDPIQERVLIRAVQPQAEPAAQIVACYPAPPAYSVDWLNGFRPKAGALLYTHAPTAQPQAAEPVLTAILIRKIDACLEDSMWADHIEISKRTLREIRAALATPPTEPT